MNLAWHRKLVIEMLPEFGLLPYGPKYLAALCLGVPFMFMSYVMIILAGIYVVGLPFIVNNSVISPLSLKGLHALQLAISFGMLYFLWSYLSAREKRKSYRKLIAVSCRYSDNIKFCPSTDQFLGFDVFGDILIESKLLSECERSLDEYTIWLNEVTTKGETYVRNV